MRSCEKKIWKKRKPVKRKSGNEDSERETKLFLPGIFSHLLRKVTQKHRNSYKEKVSICLSTRFDLQINEAIQLISFGKCQNASKNIGKKWPKSKSFSLNISFWPH